MQTLHTKFIVREPVKHEYGIMNISADAAFVYGVVAAFIVGWNLIKGHESLTLWNSMIAFIVSSLQIICILVG